MTCRFRQSSDRLNPRRTWAALVLASCMAVSGLFVVPTVVSAQISSFSLPEIPVLTIERERLFTETMFGKSLSSEIAERGRRLSAENRRIEKELADEEGELTDLRETLAAEEFRELADAFDVKVTTARSQQDTKARELSQLSEVAERRFLFTIAPIIERLMSEKGASVILDRRAVFVSADSSDITQDAITRIDTALGQGMPLTELLAPAVPAQDAAPEDETAAPEQ